MYFGKLVASSLGASSKQLGLQGKLLFSQPFFSQGWVAVKQVKYYSKLKVWSWKTKDKFYGVIT